MQRKNSVAGPESEKSPIFTLGVAGVAGQEPESGHGAITLPCDRHGLHADWWVKILADGGEMVCARCEPPAAILLNTMECSTPRVNW
jgi:hypothetical protein